MDIAVLSLIPILVFLIAFVYSNMGLGGGMLFTPLLVAFAVADKDTLVCISLFLVLATSVAAAYNHGVAKLVKYKYGLLLASFSIPGSILGVLLGLEIHARIFYVLFAMLSCAVGAKMLYDTLYARNTCVVRKVSLPGYVAVALIAFFGGMVSAMFGVGGGIFNVPVLLYLLYCQTKEASGTSSFTICLTSLGGIFTNAVLLPTFTTSLYFAIPLVFFAFFGALLGSRIGIKKLKEKPLRIIFISMLFVASIQMLIEAFF
jgi:uncharacterized membrane protein YfcA